MTVERFVDFDLHGLAGVRSSTRGSSDAAAVGRQLGPCRGRSIVSPTSRSASSTGSSTGRLRYLGAKEAGWTDDGFFVLRSRKAPVVVRLPMDRIGGRCEVVCERGLPAVPFLIAVLNLTVLGNGALPVHAAAFELDGTARSSPAGPRAARPSCSWRGLRLGPVHRRRVGVPHDRWSDVRPPGADPPVGLAYPPASRGTRSPYPDRSPEARRHPGPAQARARHAATSQAPAAEQAPARAMPTLEGLLHVDLPRTALQRRQQPVATWIASCSWSVLPGRRPPSTPSDPLEVASRMRAPPPRTARLYDPAGGPLCLSLTGERPSRRRRGAPGRAARPDRRWALRVPRHASLPVDLAALFESVRPVLAPT